MAQKILDSSQPTEAEFNNIEGEQEENDSEYLSDVNAFRKKWGKYVNRCLATRRINQRHLAGSVIRQAIKLSIVLKSRNKDVISVVKLHIELRIVRKESQQGKTRKRRRLYRRDIFAKYVVSADIGSGSVHKKAQNKRT